MSWRKASRFSVRSMASMSTPIMRTSYFSQMPCLSALDGQVEGRLAAHGGQHGVDRAVFEDLDDAFDGEGE
jgi:hypothetical protein